MLLIKSLFETTYVRVKLKSQNWLTKKKHLEDTLHIILFDESKEAKENASFTWDFCTQCKDTLSRLRQFLATARPLKMMHNIFIPP